MSPSEMWWSDVPSGAAVMDAVVQQILAGKCVCLEAPNLPWRAELLDGVRSRVSSLDAELNWNILDAVELNGLSPMEYLGSYFNVAQIPIPELILQNVRKLPTCCWVRDIPESDAEAWIQTAKALFGGKEKFHFRLVLELPSYAMPSIGRVVSVNSRVERFDIYYFALMILAKKRLDEKFQEYGATLCAELADGSAELCYELCGSINEVLRDPLTARLVAKDESAQKQLVCRAQTRSIGPLIDIGRIKLNSIFRRRLQAILPQTDEYGTTLDDVNSIELRHLVYFVKEGLIEATPQEEERLKCLHQARNDVSHLKVLSYDGILELFAVLDKLA